MIWTTSSSEVHVKWFSFEEITAPQSVSQSAKMIPPRKWMAKCENEFLGLHLLHGEMSPLRSSAFEFPQLLLITGTDKWTACRGQKWSWFKVSTASDEDEVIQKCSGRVIWITGSLPLPWWRLMWYCSATLTRGSRCLMCHCGCGFNSQAGYHFIYIAPCVLEQGIIPAVPLEESDAVLMDRWCAWRAGWMD